MYDKQQMTEKCEKIIKLLASHGMTLSVAESCSGGLLSKYITDISGSSRVYKGGVCTYCNESKVKLLGVSPETLANYGAVSRDTANQMSRGVTKLFNTDVGVGITGIAGPNSDNSQKPVGMIFISVTIRNDTEVIELYNDFTDNIRSSNRFEAVNAALSLLIQQLSSRKEQ